MLFRSERDIINLTLAGTPQVEIAKTLSLSQPSISYSLSRSAERLEYAISRPFFDPVHLRKEMDSVLPREDAELLEQFWSCGCQSTVARSLGKTQGFVRYRILRSSKAMEDSSSKVLKAYAKAIKELTDKGPIFASEG